uniref:GIY endonuclease n=1 Tax=Apiotrichum gamsii TaxID=1105092 RepID=A0A8K1ZR80_9TREE|nr:GIY endonuclease [Apiotrichum gamsii]
MIKIPFNSNIQSNLDKNYNLNKSLILLKTFIENSNNKTINNYINNILEKELTYAFLSKKYFINGVINSTWSMILPERFNHLRAFIGLKRLYAFVSYNGDIYLGSSSNLWQRLFIQHKTSPKNRQNKHKLFYNNVLRSNWFNFTLHVICILPDHVSNYLSLSSTIEENEIAILNLLNKYHLTFVEQFLLDIVKPSLNAEKFANAS